MQDSVRQGARAAAIGGAAALGTLTGFGFRGGVPSRPFNAFAELVLGDRARGVWGFDPAVTLTGIMVLVAGCAMVSVIAAGLVRLVPSALRWRHPRLVAFGLSLVPALAVLWLVAARAPEVVGATAGGALTYSQGIILTILISAGYSSGMGLAR